MSNLLRYQNIKWSMPMLFSHMMLYPVLKELNGNLDTIAYSYGSVKSKWSGGRPSVFTISNLSLIDAILNKNIEYGVTPVFTFTNEYIDKEILKDKFCNELLKIIAEKNCQIIVSNDLLFDYIKDTYPDIKLVASIIKSNITKIQNIDEATHINNLLKKYDRVVVRGEYIIKKKDTSLINDVSRVELLLDQDCICDCTNADKHYKIYTDYENDKISFDMLKQEQDMLCPKERLKTRTNSLTEEEINYAISNGIRNFKLQGRTWEFDSLFTELIKYFFSKEVSEDYLRSECNKILLKDIKNNIKTQLYAFIQ